MTYDTVVIGGGIAGLQASIQLARSLHRVLVIDRRSGRSLVAKNYRNILGYPNGVSGEELRKAGELQSSRLGVQFLYDEVVQVSQSENELFEVAVKQSTETYKARTIVLATGISDPFPSIPGLRACLGESLFICPDCDGYESVDRMTAIIGDGGTAVQFASTLLYYTKNLVLINHGGGEITSEELSGLKQQNIPVYQAAVVQIDHSQGNIEAVQLTTGELIKVQKAFLAFPGAHVNSELVNQLHVKMLDNGHILVDPRTKETSYRNIWAIGDLVTHSQQVTIAMGDGAQAAIWIHKRLLEEVATKPILSFV